MSPKLKKKITSVSVSVITTNTKVKAKKITKKKSDSLKLFIFTPFVIMNMNLKQIVELALFWYKASATV